MKACPKEKDKPKKKVTGRPAKKSTELIKRILISISVDRLSLRKACEKESISDGTFIMWVLEDETLSEQYARCMRIRNERMAEEIIDISDDVTEDDIFDENGNRKANNEWIARSRLRVDTRKWLLSKLLPKKFGDKLEIENKGEINHKHDVAISIDPVQAARDYQALINNKK